MSPLAFPTLLVGIAFAAVAWTVKPGRALGIMIVSLLVWPEYHRIPMGLSQMSAPRIVALAIVARMAFASGRSALKWNRVDKLIVAGWLWTVLANILVGASSANINQQIGRGLDTVLMYFAARVTLRSKSDYQDLVMPLALTGIYLAALGVIESFTTYSPYEWMFQLRTDIRWVKDPEFRLGLLRAKGTTQHYIYWGMSLFLLGGFLRALIPFAKNRPLAVVGTFAALVGLLSSLSSGAMISLLALIAIGLFTHMPRMIKPSLFALACLCAFVEVASNRHFYELIDYLALNKHTAYYRTRLLEVAFMQLDEFWSFGLGGNWPNHWGPLIDGRRHVDIVNHFLMVAIYAGLPALGLYLWVHVDLIRTTVRKWSDTRSQAEKHVTFGFATLLLALAVGSMSVGLFGPPVILSFVLFGSFAGLPAEAETDGGGRIVRVVRRVVRRPVSPAEPTATAQAPTRDLDLPDAVDADASLPTPTGEEP